MANQIADADADFWTSTQSARSGAELRYDRATDPFAPRDVPHRVTDPRLVLTARRANGRLKRAMDILLSLSAIIFLSPAFITIAIAMLFLDRGPLLYSHPRIGRHGRVFKCHKFRSMAVDAQERLAHLLATDAAAAAEWRETQKLRDDPRVTKLGRFLRKTSLDELPQFFNVLAGEMSLVGPRPITRAELERYGRERRYYLLVRPGITGLWQVSGRSNASYSRRVKMDRQYLECWTLFGDLMILLKTVPAVLATDDAC